jgi:ABC-2 type transport system permease protein
LIRRLAAMLRKEFRQIRRDPLSLGLLVFLPAFLLVLYGYALSFDVKHVRIAVLDLDRTPASRSLLDGFFGNPYFERVRDLERVTEADRLLARGFVRAVVIVPNDYAETLDRGDSADVEVLIDGADANTATIVIGYLDALAGRETLRVRTAALERLGRPVAFPAVVPEPRIWFNPELRSAEFLVPGLIGVLLMLAAVVATSLSIVREKERETIEQMKVSPLRPAELILGKTLPYVVICLLTMVLILTLGYFLFGVVIRGSFVLLGVTTLIFLTAALGMGILISSVTNSQQVAYQIATLTSLLPSVLLSGFIFPIKNMPLAVRTFTYVVAPRYLVSALRKIILKGAPISALWPDLAALAALALAFNLLAARNIRKML